MRRTLILVVGIVTLFGGVQAQPLRQRQRGGQRRPAFSFQSFDHSSGFEGDSSLLSSADIPSQLAAQLTSSSSIGSSELQEQPKRGNEEHNTVNLPLYKQSFPGVYVKGHAAEHLNKYEPTRKVAHHHGPNFQIPRNVASSSSSTQSDFTGDFFASLN